MPSLLAMTLSKCQLQMQIPDLESALDHVFAFLCINYLHNNQLKGQMSDYSLP